MQLYNLISKEKERERGNYFLIVCPLLRLNEARNEELSERERDRESGEWKEHIKYSSHC